MDTFFVSLKTSLKVFVSVFLAILIIGLIALADDCLQKNYEEVEADIQLIKILPLFCASFAGIFYFIICALED